MTEGCCLVMAGNKKHILNTGEGIFINSQVLHGCWAVEQSGCALHSLVFHSRLVAGSLDSIFHQGYLEPLMAHPDMESVFLSPEISWQKQALVDLEDAWQQCFQEPQGYEFQLRSSLSSLVYQLCCHMPPTPVQAARRSSRDAERIKAMLALIHEHYGTELSTRDISSAAMVSESECLRCFRHTIGTTPIQYLKQYRIQQAAQLLANTDQKVSEIAAACGFQDMSYFTRAFREEKGCTPTEYRRRSHCGSQ